MAALGEVRCQRTVVVDLAIERDPDIAAFVAEGLLTRLQVDNAKTAMGERRIDVDAQAGFVRATVYKDVSHGRGTKRRVRGQRICRNDACNSTHEIKY